MSPVRLSSLSKGGLDIMALVVYLRVIQNISYQRRLRLFRDLFGLSISEQGNRVKESTR